MAASEFAPARFLQQPAAGMQQGPAQDQHQEQGWRQKPALLILNQPVASLDLLQRLWAHTSYRLCADGGANRLYDTFDGLDDADARRLEFTPSFLASPLHLLSLRLRFPRDSHTLSPYSSLTTSGPSPQTQLPTIIHGDLDSLREDVRAYYASHGVRISRDPDQYSTDFGKASKQITSAVPAPPPPAYREILILCTLGGRVDQGLGLLYEMLRIQAAHAHTRLWLFSESSVSFILPPGEHRIDAPVVRRPQRQGARKEQEGQAFFTENVGILPAFGPATITTTGLEWDVADWPTSVDGNVSTSNHVKAECVTVRTDAKVLFTIERA
ncbi:Riboflavin kinase domain bacterial/eukaryotic [Macrophomina phaseolina MS6]|uniref:Thiamine pyrophosphokinase n=1 Tax=Macrophomina phaseolina (strain MS6) TaxID=1126212 RepID=K2RKQ0_MACPH|nr:Riboflavin kinase domain bacterial/eukaryotic [Macrophomina phaseolina MS6]